MRKLLQLNECLNFSTGKIAQLIGEEAIKKGWESWIAYSSLEPIVECKSKIIKVGSCIDPYIHFAESRFLDREGLSSKKATKRLIKEIKAISPDVVQLHNIHDHWLNYQILFEYLIETNIKVVWTFHDSWAFTGHCFHFVTKGCERWKTECYDCPLQKEYPKSFVDRSKKNFELKKTLFSANNNLTIVACSEWMSGLARRSFLKDKRIEIIKNGIDLSTFKPEPRQKKQSNTFNILAVSNVWNKEKGLYDIFSLRNKLPEEYKITIVGLTKRQLAELPKGINGIIRTNNVQEMVDLYCASDVLINPTYADTFPTVNIEALACDTPVITYKTGGSPEIIDDKTGFVVSQGDIIGMANAIFEIHRSPIEPNICRRRAEELFDKNKCFEAYINLYKELIK